MPSIREFKAKLSFYVAESRAGRPVNITWHRRPVARLVGIPQEEAEGIARMIAEGDLTWSGGKPAGSNYKIRAAKKSVSQMVIEDRG